MNKQGRRHFLGGSASAAVAAIAGCAPATTVSAQSCRSHYDRNPKLVKVIIRAWQDPAFKEQLLTFPATVAAPSWQQVSPANRAMMVNRTFGALQQAQISQVEFDGQPMTLGQYPPTGAAKSPVVLTASQYSAAPYVPAPNELLFVLPDAVAPPSSVNAEKAMCIHPFGM
ncbi:MAG: hypothetical protein J0I21_18915 [Alphaproteobacteria bacterium]|nr:hypothetical protein [Alphaproteobacteria bacterium]